MSEVTRTVVLYPDICAGAATTRTPAAALEEGVALAQALHLDVTQSLVVPLQSPRPGTLFGTGKVDELGTLLAQDDAELVIIDGPVTPVQQRNLERAWKVKILDRTGLILEIFADRARTREGVLQVELAALSYQRTRLVRSWTHLERQRGGLGFVGGPGETQIEADRRAIDDAIGRIRRQLEKVTRTRGLHRAARKKVPFPIVALVGYTNAGKSTLFNHMTGAQVMAKDMLFATLDPTMRAIDLPGGARVILSDTVGFISDLPTQLVAAFRATLEEVLDADLIVHVRDISSDESDAQAADVMAILYDLGIDPETAPILEVWNKSDLLDDDARAVLTNQSARRDDVLLVSALTGQGMDALLAGIEQALTPKTRQDVVRLAFNDGRRRAWLYEQGVVIGEAADEDGLRFDVEWSGEQADRFAALD